MFTPDILSKLTEVENLKRLYLESQLNHLSANREIVAANERALSAEIQLFRAQVETRLAGSKASPCPPTPGPKKTKAPAAPAPAPARKKGGWPKGKPRKAKAPVADTIPFPNGEDVTAAAAQ